jgi:endonuclease YncB( thermonuclease family)
MYIEAKEPIKYLHTTKFQKWWMVMDYIVYNIFNKKEIEIRLLGIDAPEIKDVEIKTRRKRAAFTRSIIN